MSLKRFINQEKPFIKMDDSSTVQDAIGIMIERKKGAVIVLQDGDRIGGVFTERDVMTKIVAEGRDPAKTPLRDVMTKDVVMLPATSSLDHAIKIMGKNGIRHLPVEDQNHNIIGMISLRHLLHEKVDMVIEELNAVDAYHNDSLGG